MKLILAVDALTPALSGIGRYTWEMASRMGQAPGVEQVRYYRAGLWIEDPATLLVSGSARRNKPFFKYPRWAKDLYWQHACRGQVFHAPNYFLPPYAENGVVTVHDLSVFKFPETHPVERVKQFEKLFRQTLAIAGHLITDSEVTRQEIIAYFGWSSERVTAIHLGVSPLFTPRTAAELTPVLHRYGLTPGAYTLCVSTIEPRKRIDSLLAAYARLPKEILAAYPLVLVGGKGWHSEHLHTAIEAAQQAGWLHYLGFVDEADLPAIYAGAHLFVYPSIYEGFGLPVVEAMASGVPVVTSNCSTLPEISAGAARLVDPHDIDALSVAIEASILDASWRHNSITAGLKVAASYCWDKCCEQTQSVYRTVDPVKR